MPYLQFLIKEKLATNMEIKGRLVQVLPAQTGAGKNGPWKKQDIIIETQGQYPKKVCVSVWGDKITESQLKLGSELNIFFDVESREYNGKWYTDVKAWKVDSGTGGGDGGSGFVPQEEKEWVPDGGGEDLPF
jgi:hypothetical protein